MCSIAIFHDDDDDADDDDDDDVCRTCTSFRKSR